jgi:hypothetical protein
MPELNKANRQVCDVEIIDLLTGKPFLFFDDANTTTQNIQGDSTYANARGQRAIAFNEPMNGTMTIEAQVVPFKLYSLMSDGVVRHEAEYPVREVVKASEAGKLTLKNTPSTADVYVYEKGTFGDEDAALEASVAAKVVSCSEVTIGKEYEVGYVVARKNGVNRISFGDSYATRDYKVVMRTLDKDEEGKLTPYVMYAYKATPQRNFEMSQASTGDPASLTVTLDLLADKEGRTMDMIEEVAESDV